MISFRFCSLCFSRGNWQQNKRLKTLSLFCSRTVTQSACSLSHFTLALTKTLLLILKFSPSHRTNSLSPLLSEKCAFFLFAWCSHSRWKMTEEEEWRKNKRWFVYVRSCVEPFRSSICHTKHFGSLFITNNFHFLSKNSNNSMIKLLLCLTSTFICSEKCWFLQ